MTMKLLIALACAFALAYAHPQNPPSQVTRNTIFTEERFQGEIFENVEAFTNIQLYNEDVNPYRLPITTKPIHYNVYWDINLISSTYAGTVDIQLAATQAGVNEIVIHSDHTILSYVNLTQNGVPIQITYRFESQYQFLRIRPNIDLEYDVNNTIVYTLSIGFSADIRTDMAGIYGSWFRTNTSDPESAISYMATTQFQPTSARFAFPCYDEPSFKATFDIIIRRPTTHRSWSCTLIMNTYPNGTGHELDVYHTTPVMSTYLLALIVADYDSIPDTVGSPLYEVIAREQAIQEGQGDFALYVGRDLLDMMSIHTDYEYYSMDDNLKMTQAAIPDFSAGAMENWGLLTYREAYLMYDENETNSYSQQLIAYILSHEIAHMWFGNLVTCDWWDVLWLNEGFARYYQYFLTHWVRPEMAFETRFITEQVHTALLADSADNPHPLTNPGVGSPGAVWAMFSTLSYNKGAAIIRQTEHFLGTEVHTEGLRNYLEQRNFETAKPLDLFQALESVANEEGALEAYGPEFSFVEYYESWTEQPGHPVLNVHVNHATGDMTITQRRFSINTGFSNVGTNYIVPITFATASEPDFSNTKPTHVLTSTVTVINRGTVGVDEWVIFNKQQTGFYSVNYDNYTWDLIAIVLRNNRTVIHEYNRAQIVYDIFHFARSGLITYNRAFNILEFMENETEYAPWLAAISGFNWLRNRLASTPEQLTELNNLFITWATNVMTQLTYEPIIGESFLQSYLRYQIAPVMCAVGVTACRTSATAQFQALRNSGTPVPVDSRNWVYCNALRDGTSLDFDFLWDRFLTHNVYTEKILLLQALGCTSDATSLHTLLDAIVEPNFVVRPQDYTTAFSAAVSGNEENTMIVFQYIQSNLTLVTEAFGTATTPLSYISSRLRTREQVLQFQQWANATQAELGPDYPGVYGNTYSTLESIQWADDAFSDFNDYFTSDGYTFTTTTQGPETTVEITTITPEDLERPVTPELDGSAVSTVVSMFLLSLGIIGHLLF